LAYSRGSGPDVRAVHARPDDSPLIEERQTSDLDLYFEESIRGLNAPPRQPVNALPDEVQLLMEDVLNNVLDHRSHSEFSPPLSLTSSLSFRPLILAQAKLVNAATLRLFFRSHQLRHLLITCNRAVRS
jgi:hypothetical protein